MNTGGPLIVYEMGQIKFQNPLFCVICFSWKFAQSEISINTSFTLCYSFILSKVVAQSVKRTMWGLPVDSCIQNVGYFVGYHTLGLGHVPAAPLVVFWIKSGINFNSSHFSLSYLKVTVVHL